MLGFGSKRKKATRAAVEALRMYMAVMQNTHGIPAGFWRDSYVLGFMHQSVGLFAKLATGGKIHGEQLGHTLIDSVSALSNMNGLAIVERMNELALRSDKEFLRGSQDALAVIIYTYGVHDNEQDDPLVISATETAAAFGLAGSPDERRQQIAGIMMQQSLFSHVRQNLAAY